MARTGLVTSPGCRLHEPGPGHPERPARLAAIERRLAEVGLIGDLDPAEAAPAARAAIELVHPGTHIEHVEREVNSGAAFVDSADANVGPGSFDAALLAAGGALLAVDRVASGAWKNAFVAVRPPGHHAEESRAMGFCLFNNVALAARHIQRAHGLRKVAILDWDVHHGNGTQHIFERDPDVFYASLHQYPHYPGTGAADERGLGDGEGSVLNCPMAPGTGDYEWLAAFETEVLPALDAFGPEFLLISAGFDAHARDPLSATLLTESAFERMTVQALALAADKCGGRVVSVLEGGYDLEGLARSVEAHVRALSA